MILNEYEKANRQPGRPSPTRPPQKQVSNLTRRCQKAGFKVVHLHFPRLRTSVQISHFRRQNAISRDCEDPPKKKKEEEKRRAREKEEQR